MRARRTDPSRRGSGSRRAIRVLRGGCVALAVVVVTAIGLGPIAGERFARAASAPTVSSAQPRPIPPIAAPRKLPRAPRDRFVRPRSGALQPAVPLPNGVWRPLGPAMGIGRCYPCLPDNPSPLLYFNAGLDGGYTSGRVLAMLQIPSGAHAGRIVAATAGGGVWTADPSSSLPGGLRWTPRSDQAPSLAIGSLALDPKNPNHLIAGSGEGDGATDGFYGFGVLSSTDGGTTWTNQDPGGVFDGAGIAGVAIDPSNSKHMFAATTRGLFVTSDGGATWAKPADSTYTAVDGNINAVVLDPANPSTVYISGGSKFVAKSTDGGVTWSPMNAGINPPTANCVFIALAISKTSPSTLYASVGTSCNGAAPVALYNTTNGGGEWNPVLAAPDYTGAAYAYGSGTLEQGAYDNVVAIDPTNANHVLAGGMTVVESSDGGTTWTNVNGGPFRGRSSQNPLHPDQHGLWFAPDGSVLIGNDGGVYRYGAGQIANLNFGLAITQFYPGMTETGPYPVNILGGTQDNSTTFGGPQEVPCQSGGTLCSLQPGLTIPLDWLWGGLNTGDGGPTAQWIDSSNTMHTLYESDQSLFLTNSYTSERQITPIPCTIQGGGCANAPFTPPMIAVPNPADKSNPTVFYGANDLWRTTNPTASSPSWAKVTADGNGVSAVVAAPSNRNVIYVAFADGTVQVSTDGGVTFGSLAPNPFGVKGGGAAVTYGADTLTDTSRSWTPGQWAGNEVNVNRNNYTVASNTATTLTVTAPWATPLPTAGNTYTLGEPYVTGLSVDPTNPQAITASFSYAPTRDVRVGLDNPHVAQYSYTTNPATGSWSIISGNLPANIGVSRVIYDNGALVAATDSGVYATGAPNAASTVWSHVGIGMPNVQVEDLVFDPTRKALFAVTHGRGAWQLMPPIIGAAVAGYQGDGEYGDGDTADQSSLPVLARTPTGAKVKTVAAGDNFELALLANGNLLAWGNNGRGQLGNGTNTSSSLPVKVKLSLPAGVTVTAIAGGSSDSLALLSNGSVLAWGYNASGQLGNGTNTDSNVPVPVSLPAGATAKAIATYNASSLALLTDGSVLAWGENLGNGNGSPSNVPMRVSLPAGSTATAVAVGGFHSLAALSDGSVYAWGDNTYGQLGDGTNTNANLPVKVQLPAGTAAKTLSAGGYFSLTLLTNGNVLAWGNNAFGQLGNATNTDSNVPVKVAIPAGDTVQAIAAGGLTSYALLSDRSTLAWGDNNSYYMFGNAGPSSNVPVTGCPASCDVLSIDARNLDSIMVVDMTLAP